MKASLTIHPASRRPATTWWGMGLLALFTLCWAAPSHAAPVLDGNIDDVIAQAIADSTNGTGCGLVRGDDHPMDVCKTDPLIVPCTLNTQPCPNNPLGIYFTNGYDEILNVVDVHGQDTWLG